MQFISLRKVQCFIFVNSNFAFFEVYQLIRTEQKEAVAGFHSTFKF